MPVVGGDDLKFTVGGRWLAVFEALADVADPDRFVQVLGLGGLLLRRLQVGRSFLRAPSVSLS